MAPDIEKTPGLPDTEVNVKDVFGLDSKMVVPAFSAREEHALGIAKPYRPGV
jgi:hypothetical protein